MHNTGRADEYYEAKANRKSSLSLISLFLAFTLSGCASFNGTYMDSSEFRTMEECRIARRLGTIDDEALFQCAVDRLPEYGFGFSE